MENRGSLIYIRRPCDPGRPQRKIFYIRNEYLSIANCVLKFNFLSLLSLVVSKITGGPKFTLDGPVPPGRPKWENFLYPERVLYHI